MNYLKQKEGRRVLEAQESSYRTKFPKGRDWEDPKPNPFTTGVSTSPDAIHGVEITAISIEKYNDLMKDFSTVVTTLNNLLQGDPKNEYIKKTLQRVGIFPKGDIH